MSALPNWDCGSAALLRETEALLAAPALAWLGAFAGGWHDDPLLRLDHLLREVLPSARAAPGAAARRPGDAPGVGWSGGVPSRGGFEPIPVLRRPQLDSAGIPGAGVVLRDTFTPSATTAKAAASSTQPAWPVAAGHDAAQAEVATRVGEVAAGVTGPAARRAQRLAGRTEQSLVGQPTAAVNANPGPVVRAISNADPALRIVPATSQPTLPPSITGAQQASIGCPPAPRSVPPSACVSTGIEWQSQGDDSGSALSIPIATPADPRASVPPASLRLVDGLPALQGLMRAAVADSQQRQLVAGGAPTAPAATALPAAVISPAPAALPLRALPMLDALAEEMLVDRLADRLQDRLRDEALRHFGFTGGVL